jgi:hypothetical protein
MGYSARNDRMEYRANINGVNDLGYASADYLVALRQNGSEFEEPENIRLRFRRQNIHEGALPLGLEDVQWGDVSLSNRDLISSGRSGRGILFTNRKDVYRNEFDVITVEGIAQPGWEVELYVNNGLIDVKAVDERGEYRFEDISIGYGNNRVRVVLYGPQGQVEERVENYFYQSNMAKKGQAIFSGGIVDAGKDLIPVDERDTYQAKGLAANVYGAYGVHENITLFSSANTIKDDKVGTGRINDVETKKYLSAGAITAYGANIAQLEAYKELDGGEAVDLRTISDFMGFKVNTRSSLYHDFESPDAGVGQNAKDYEFEVDLRKSFVTGAGVLSTDFGVEHTKKVRGNTQTTYTTRQSMSVMGTRFTNSTDTTLNDHSHTSTRGNFSTSTRMNDWRLRNYLNYRIFPDVDLTSFSTDLRYGSGRDYSTGINLFRNFETKETRLGLQFSKDYEKFLGSISADWSSDHGFGLLLRASAGIGPFGPDGDYIVSSDPLRNSGPISSFVYRDLNYDGVFNEGDVPEKGTRISVGSRYLEGESDEEGHVSDVLQFASGRQNITVDPDSIDDPYLMPTTPGYQAFLRPGSIHTFEFPLVETGAIDGTLRWADSGKPIAGLSLQLMKSDAEIVKESKSGTDGYFTFERILPGEYTIRAAPETGMSIPNKRVVLTPDNLFQFGTDIEAIDLDAEPETDLEIAVKDDAMLSAEGIISIAKGFKGKSGKITRSKGAAKPSAVPLAPQAQKQIPRDVSKVSPSSGPTLVSDIRMGQHPGKTRVVLDLSSPMDFSINYDPTSNSVFVDMPFADWSAAERWQRQGKPILLHNYRVERDGNEVKLILGVEDDIKIVAYGLLKPYAGKKDRLYIDIEKQ